jgi:hypothetical protein
LAASDASCDSFATRSFSSFSSFACCAALLAAASFFFFAAAALSADVIAGALSLQS